MLKKVISVSAMIDPRNFPYARVCLSPLSARELPPNALQQYYKYVTKKKISDSTLVGFKDLNRTTMSVQKPAISNSLAVTDHLDTGVNRSDAAQDIFSTRTSSQERPSNFSHLPEDNQDTTSGSMKNATETIGEEYPKPFSPCMIGGGWSDGVECKVMKTNIASMPVQDLVAQHLLMTKLDVKTDDVQHFRRNSVRSLSSGSLQGREHAASVHVRPVVWDSPTVSKRKCVNFKPKTSGESNDEAMSNVTDQCTPSLTVNMCNSILGAQGLSYEQMSSVTSTSYVEETSDASVISDESTLSESLCSMKDHSLCGCEDVWADFNSYSPPESPDPQNTENVISPLEPEKVFPIEAKITVPLKTGILNNVEVKDTSRLNDKSEVHLKHSSTEHIQLLSPKIKLVSLDIKDNRGFKRKFSLSKASPAKRKLLSPRGDLVIKLSDIGDKLQPCPKGGFTVADSTKTGRYTSFGRRILTNYSEKSLAKSVMKRALPKEKKKRKVKKKAKCLLHIDQKCTCRIEKPNGRPKKGKKDPRKRDKTLLHYENLPFKKLNTIPRISTRYKVAFSKWPYVFSGALDLINQRISNQNALWNSIRA